MTWVAVAVGAGALISGAASYAGSKKQAGAAKSASNQQLQMFDRLNAQQQPFIQSGYGAMGKLNTLLGIGGGPSTGEMSLGGNATLMPRQNTMYRPTPGGGIQAQAALGAAPPQNMRLQQILALRAANGDTEAQRILGSV